MGEAKRRKAAGTYPDNSDPVAKARAFWDEKSLTPVEDFRVPEGTIAVTFDVEGVDPSTAVINPADYDRVAPRVDRIARAHAYYDVVIMTASAFKQVRQSGDPEGLSTVLPWLALWTAYNHPKGGETMRKGVSEDLRLHGKAHMTWRAYRGGMALALADRFVDLDEVAGLTPKDRVSTIVRQKFPERPMH